MATFEGVIVELKTRQAASGDQVTTCKLEIHGDFNTLHQLMKKPLRFSAEELQ